MIVVCKLLFVGCRVLFVGSRRCSLVVARGVMFVVCSLLCAGWY